MFSKVYQVNAIVVKNDSQEEFTLCHSIFNFDRAKKIAENSHLPAYVESFPIPHLSNSDSGTIEFKNKDMIDLECNAVYNFQNN